MYFNKAIALLTCGASLSLLSIGIMAWAPRSAILNMFGSGCVLSGFWLGDHSIHGFPRSWIQK